MPGIILRAILLILYVGTDPVELDEIVSEFRSKNRKFAGEVDRIFLIKKQQLKLTEKHSQTSQQTKANKGWESPEGAYP